MTPNETGVLLRDLQDGLLVLTLNRPERRNALDPALTEALRDAALDAAGDPEVRAILIQGAGGTFCVGGDVKAMNEGAFKDRTLAARTRSLRDRMEAARALHEAPKPTIAAIEGAAAGAGLSLALACDLRICADDAKLTTAFAKVGLSGDYGGTYFLSRLIGPARARELYLTSPVLTGAQAQALGLVSRAVPADQVRAQALALARQLAAGPTLTYAGIKRNFAMAESGASLADCFDEEARNHSFSATTADHREAAAAFVEKRAPAFTGR